MSLKRMSVLVLAFGAACGCTAYTTLNSATVDCSAENAYDFDPNPIPLGNAYSAGDMTPNSTVTVGSMTVPDALVCGSASGLLIQGSHNNDWGFLAGFYGLGIRDESAYEGVSFWARAPGESIKSFTLALDDANTYATTPDAGTNCTNYYGDGSNTINPSGTVYDPATNMPISGVSTTAPPPNACGNSYSMIMTVTADWRFYTIPFTEFHQAAMPDRVPNPSLMDKGGLPGSGLLTNQLMNIIFRMPREAQITLWVGKLDFYRNKTPGTGGDGGVNAP
jgi:hypothetical protein